MSPPELKLTMELADKSGDVFVSPVQLLEESQTLRQLIDSHVAPARPLHMAAPRPGEKGLPVVIGAMLIEALSAGVCTALIDCIKVWSESRKREFNIRIEKGGDVLEFQASNMDQRKIVDLTQKLEALLAK